MEYKVQFQVKQRVKRLFSFKLIFQVEVFESKKQLVKENFYITSERSEKSLYFYIFNGIKYNFNSFADKKNHWCTNGYSNILHMCFDFASVL